ncbi:exodeoxyribonuclease V subunit alpha [Thermomonas alba]|uniref:exodeoxyribonuclease V subunit alpha n=1 Tax=Thermomonas alba TaxID=2888525 RepID=UPI001F04A137|nr:exodeoxyribonuclease V subunit alpha [Thermomonas alba]
MSFRVAGERFGFTLPPRCDAVPDGWRDLDRAVWRWVLAHGGDAATALAAGWLSHAEGEGHSALSLRRTGQDGRPLLDAAQRAALACSPLVTNLARGEIAQDRPFVLDGDSLYLLRNYRAEVFIADAIRARRAAARPPRCPVTRGDLRVLFNGSWQDGEERQRAAVCQAVGRRLMILTGGPGTGKTTTVLRMLLALSREHHAHTGALPQLRIAAPTGKAAQRLAESLQQGVDRLQAGLLSVGQDWLPHLQAVQAIEAATVHRLLGSRGHRGGYTYHADEPLPADIVVVDEASMLDLGMLRALLAALRDDAVLVLVGDADQLTSVGTGSVMMDVVQALEADPRGDLVRLSHCFRADRALVPINEAVRSGDAAAFASAIAAAAVHQVPDVVSLRRRVLAWARDLQTTLAQAGIATPVDVGDQQALAARLAVLRRQQLLCALREGPFGAVQVAQATAARLRTWDALSPWADGQWYPGRCVMITRNDHAARLYNGDVGICVLVQEAGTSRLQVAFEGAQDPGVREAGSSASSVRLLDPGALPPHEDAFAITVHKSQGSEYDRVAVLLPPDPTSPLLVRQLLYTGVSRAKTALELWAMPEVTQKALATALVRHGQLARRITGPPRG